MDAVIATGHGRDDMAAIAVPVISMKTGRSDRDV
jgi:hypothetical protein